MKLVQQLSILAILNKEQNIILTNLIYHFIWPEAFNAIHIHKINANLKFLQRKYILFINIKITNKLVTSLPSSHLAI